MSNPVSLAIRRFPALYRGVMEARERARRLGRGVVELVRRLPAPFSLGLPPGVYSDLSLLQASPRALEGRVVLLDQGNPEAAPDSMLVRCGRQQHLRQPWPVFWTHHREAELVSQSLVQVDAAGRLCEEAAYHSAFAGDHAWFYPRRLTRAVRLAGNWTSLVSRWMPLQKTEPYGHWILDALPRLALLGEFPPDTRILVPEDKLPYRVQSLEMLGLLDRCRWTAERHLKIENYYFSAPSSMIACWNPYAIRWIRQAFIPLVAGDPRPSPKRFYVRRLGNVRNIANEEEVLDFFRGLGWDIVDPGAMTFADQVRYFSRAEAICAIHGSGFTNTLWCPPGTRLLELFVDQYPAADAEWIARCLPPTQHRHLIFPGDHRLNAIVDLGRVKQALGELGLL
jgi:hypothetical protein